MIDVREGEAEETIPFALESEFEPAGDQPQAIAALVDGIERGIRHQVLLGVTGSGKTFTIANVIQRTQRPALVLAHNKTLAAQLYREMKDLFPHNAVEYFVSYYDYYQPEAYIPSTDTFIEKDAAINDELDKMRLAATKHLLERKDVIVVSSVSCIYGIGSPMDYGHLRVFLEKGQRDSRNDILKRLVAIQYRRSDHDFHRGTFRVRGDVVDVFPAYEEKKAIRLEFFGDEIEEISEIDPLSGAKRKGLLRAVIYPGSHYVLERPKMDKAVITIEQELEERVDQLKAEGKLLELTRLEQRVRYDLELMKEMGTCNGIENYSRHLTGRPPGAPPFTLLDYFPDDFLLIIDESHVTLPQVRGMYEGDRSRKTVLVDFGFRLPSAMDNRPLKGDEFDARIGQTIFVSATPAEKELELSVGLVVEQLIRPTGLVDPEIVVKPARGQVEDVVSEIRPRVEAGDRVLVTCLTKRSAEDLAEYMTEIGLKAKYMHSDIDAIERTEILRDLRLGRFDVLIGINLLREGLDLPEVSLVAILDADKEGFLRGRTALIQTIGRAARNVNGRVIMYADKMTDAINNAIAETDRRRARQVEYNEANGITPRSIRKSIGNMLDTTYDAVDMSGDLPMAAEGAATYADPADLRRAIDETRAEMKSAAQKLDFEVAATTRDRLLTLERAFAMGAGASLAVLPPSGARPQPESKPYATRKGGRGAGTRRGGNRGR